MVNTFPPIPPSQRGDRDLVRWWNNVRTLLGDAAQIVWTQINFTGSLLTSIETRLHSNLQTIEGADDTDTDATQNKHVSNNDMKVNTDHVAATSAHGATGAVIGAGDLATTIAVGVVLEAAAVTDAVASTVSVTSADATDLTTNNTLTNEIKGDVNTLVTDVNAVKDQLNSLMANLRTSGALST